MHNTALCHTNRIQSYRTHNKCSHSVYFGSLIYATAMFVQTTIGQTRKTVSFSFGCDKKLITAASYVKFDVRRRQLVQSRINCRVYSQLMVWKKIVHTGISTNLAWNVCYNAQQEQRICQTIICSFSHTDTSDIVTANLYSANSIWRVNNFSEKFSKTFYDSVTVLCLYVILIHSFHKCIRIFSITFQHCDARRIWRRNECG